MKEAEISNEQLARDLNVSLRLIQKYRAGKAYPRPERMMLIARQFGRSVGWFQPDKVAA